MRIKIIIINNMLIFIFLFFLLYSNFISRIIGYNLNALFYLSFLLLLIYSLRKYFLNKIIIFQLFIVLFFAIYIFDTSFDFSANLLTIKDFIVPLLCLGIGMFFTENKLTAINYLNILYLFFIAYGIIQEVCFYTGYFYFLPWDVNYSELCIANGVVNIYQGNLLRFFGMMNSSIEYQVFVSMIPLFLLLNYNVIVNKRIFIINFILSILFLTFSFERSPIIMFLIVLIIWKFKDVLKFKNFIIVCFMVLTIFTFINYNIDFLLNNEYTKYAYQRLINGLFLKYNEDAAILERNNLQWKISKDIATKEFFGIGPGRITPSASEYKGYIGPHNNFLAFYLAYGIVGLILFLIFILFIIMRLSKIKNNFKLFGYGIIVSFFAMAMFNMPFSGKQGIIFYMLLGYLINEPLSQTIVPLSSKSTLKLKESM
ncbi:O-antigen ligase family protein [Pelotomaculum isophthalicicum JI]|uniref:O-antigen ligase family protein n=1 Tax=Pelotomaculum isophthalicicum JI TaxID=947010 RepID=A0A9X4JUR0_9FIRM|nr:O-antigen ligase family protein [Pelotomaculum isophthalicicum]MDF9406791.1 O-antigen ligase family protein [Pelotomaculum isophthalicicum JI]